MPFINRCLLLLLIIFIPHHGFLTTLLPDAMRFWKEGILLLLLCVNLKNIKYKIKNIRSWIDFLQEPLVWILLLGLYGTVLILTHQDPKTSLIAFRYLFTFYAAFLIFTLALQGDKKEKIKEPKVLVLSCIVSIIFGLWAHFLGGYEILAHLYSQTISSWVPGQTLPLYHEADGIARMQGTASGPVAFGHMMLGALFLALFKIKRKNPKQILNTKNQTLATGYWLLATSLLLLAITFSSSRAAMLAALILILIKICTSIKWHANPKTIGALITLVMISMLLMVSHHAFLRHVFDRAGTSDHLTRPIAALQEGFQHPFFGALGSYGPAARIKNLATHDNDQAPIAENVLADTFVQLGFMGLFFILGFWISLYKKTSSHGRIWIWILLLTTSLATLFDMIPLSIICAWILAQEGYSSRRA